MSFMTDTARHLQLSDVNRRMAEDPAEFVREECARYLDEVEEVAAWLNNVNVRRRVLLLSGPSSSGKTSTANLICQSLRRDGADAYVVSLDDFYLGRGMAPRLPDGSFDYESPEALDLPQLSHCIRELLEEGHTFLPQYDFPAGRPKEEKRELTLEHRSVVIFEGIHALHPKLREQLPQKHVKRLLIHAQSEFYDGERQILSQREIRFIRRMVRDERHRDSSAAQTLDMWPQVVHGEEAYLFPHVDCADMVVDTTHAFEPCLFVDRAVPLLRSIAADDPHYDMIAELKEDMARFVPVSPALLPADSIMQEFLG